MRDSRDDLALGEALEDGECDGDAGGEVAARRRGADDEGEHDAEAVREADLQKSWGASVGVDAGQRSPTAERGLRCEPADDVRRGRADAHVRVEERAHLRGSVKFADSPAADAPSPRNRRWAGGSGHGAAPPIRGKSGRAG